MSNLRLWLTAAQAYRSAAQTALAERLATRPIDAEQRAAHGFAWVATTVAALEATLDWLEAGSGTNSVDTHVATLAFAEGIGQLAGGLPMGQNEMFRAADLGIGEAARTLANNCTGLLDTDHAATRAELATALALRGFSRPPVKRPGVLVSVVATALIVVGTAVCCRALLPRVAHTAATGRGAEAEGWHRHLIGRWQLGPKRPHTAGIPLRADLLLFL